MQHTQFSAAALGMQAAPESIEHVRMTRQVARELQIAERTIIPLADLNLYHVIKVRRVFPCHECQAPVCVVQFSDRPSTRVVDAVPGPNWKTWTADVLTPHDCAVFPVYSKDGLSHCYGDVPRASKCLRCGRLVAYLKVGANRPRWYEAVNHSDEGFRVFLSERHWCS